MYNELNIGQQALVFLFFAGAFAFVYMLLAIGFRKLQEFVAMRNDRSFKRRFEETRINIEANKTLSNQVEEKLKAGRNSISC